MRPHTFLSQNHKSLTAILLALGLAVTGCTHNMITPPVSTVDAQATPQTKALQYNLIQLTGEKILFGHQDDTAYGHAWKDLPGESDTKRTTGDYPAVYGWDLSGLEQGPDSKKPLARFEDVRRLVQEAHKRGGINTFSWHSDNPATGGNTWDVSDKTVVKSILSGGANHEKYKTWLDRIADYLLTLKDENGQLIPILFRPYHEHTGSWFWWGETLCTPEEFITLWRFTVTYLRDTRGLHHLLYVYSPDKCQTKEEYIKKYPGDDWVDVLGADIYHSKKTGRDAYVANLTMAMQTMSEISHKNKKPFALTETGLEQITDPTWFTETLYKTLQPWRPVFVLCWRNAHDLPHHYYVPFPGHPASEDFIKFKNLPDVLFESELPAMYSFPRK